MSTRQGLDRLITFLDAVVAIAITLLVLPLVDVLSDLHGASLTSVLRDNEGRFAAFLLSFAVITRLWQAHHRIIERVAGYDSAFVWVNFGWLLTIVFLPFATQVAADYGSDVRLAVAIYLGTVALSSVMLAVLSMLVIRREPLHREGLDPEEFSPRVWLTPTLLLLAALVLGVAVPAVNYWATLLLVLSGPIEHRLRLRQERSVPHAAGG